MEWRDIVGYEGLYEVNEYEEVRNSITGNKLKPYANGPTLSVSLSKDYNRKHHSVSKLAIEAFKSPDDRIRDKFNWDDFVKFITYWETIDALYDNRIEERDEFVTKLQGAYLEYVRKP